MPPEPLPFDRKDFFKERKPSSSDPAGVVPVRWRETPTTPSSHPNHNGPFSYRCGGAGGSSDFRRPFSGHRKQVGGGWHVTTLEPWQDKFCGIENRENNNHSNSMVLASSSQKDRNGGNFRETTASPNDNSHPHSDFVNSWDQILPKDQHDKNNGQRLVDNENLLGTSIDWKPLKWIRSGSLTSRGSGFSHSGSSSKSIGLDTVDMKINAVPGNTISLQSPSEDAATCLLTPRTPADDATSRKKARLGWGEGLAKYEKKKVGPDDDIVDKESGGARSGTVGDGVSNLEPLLPSPCSQLDKSPSLTGCSECASPATPYSFACSSSPGIDEKASVKAKAAAEVDDDICNPGRHPSSCQGSPTFNLENLELTEAVNMTSLLNELLQSADETNTQQASSGFVRSTAMDKLQVWKADISRTLEITESEIDSLENELKSLVSDDVGAASSSLPVASCSLPPTECNDIINAEEKSGHLSLREVSSGGDMSIEKGDDCVEEEEEHIGVKDFERESPGTATSKFVEPPFATSLDNLTPSERDSSYILDIMRSENNAEAKCSQDDDVSLSTDPVGGGGEVVHNKTGEVFHALFASNKDVANEASDELTNLLPSSSSQWRTNVSTATTTTDSILVKERFSMRKRFLKFKERVIALKFRAFQYVWKEDLRLLSVRKSGGAKSQKKFESSSRLGFADYQKHRSSIRSRFSSPAGNLSLVPTTEIVDYANKLLLCDSQTNKIYRNKVNTLKMPSLILDRSERMTLRFESDNGLVEDPCKVEKERSLGSHWTPEEKETFLEKFSLFGKDFRKIASFLDHRKTVADCVEFYYKNHKSEVFQKTKKHPEFAKEGKSCTTNTYLVTSGKRWSRGETNAAASLDLLGTAAASAMADVEEGGSGGKESQSQRKCTPKFYIGTSRGDHKRVNGGGTVIDERETAADVLAGICGGSISSEALSSCITSLVDSAADVYPHHHHNNKLLGGGGYYSSSRHLSSRDAAYLQNDAYEEETCSDDDSSCGGGGGEMMMMNHFTTDWTDVEKLSFLQAVRCYGKDFSMISRCMKTRSRDECKVFYSKARKCLGLDAIHAAGGKAAQDQDHPDQGHDDETCMVDSGSVISCDKSSSSSEMKKIGGAEEDLQSSDSKHESDQIVVNNECRRMSEEEAITTTTATATATATTGGEDAHAPPQIDHPTTCAASAGVKVEIDALDLSINPVNSSSNNGVVEKTCDDNGFSSSPAASASASASCLLFNGGGPTVVASHRKTLSQDDITSRLSFRKSSSSSTGGGSQRCSSTDGYHHLHLLPKHSLMDCVESSQVLRGYPVTVSPSPSPPGASLQICSTTTQEQRQQGLGSGSDTMGKQPPTGGDVKLFGQILTQSKPKINGNGEEKTTSGRKSFNLKFDSSLHSGSRDFGGGLQDVPLRRSYGFWDGSRIQQTGLLPDSSILLAKYPSAAAAAAFGGTNSVGSNNVVSGFQTREVFNGVSVSVSDPVAAIRMHYAKTEQQQQQYKNVNNGAI